MIRKSNRNKSFQLTFLNIRTHSYFLVKCNNKMPQHNINAVRIEGKNNITKCNNKIRKEITKSFNLRVNFFKVLLIFRKHLEKE